MAFKRHDHERLREHLRGRSSWVLSYDDHQWIREAYADCRIKRTHTNGNGGAKRELIIQPVESKQTLLGRDTMAMAIDEIRGLNGFSSTPSPEPNAGVILATAGYSPRSLLGGPKRKVKGLWNKAKLLWKRDDGFSWLQPW